MQQSGYYLKMERSLEKMQRSVYLDIILKMQRSMDKMEQSRKNTTI